MAKTLVRSATLSISAFLVFGLTACAGGSSAADSADERAAVETTEEVQVSGPPTLEESQANIQWPEGLTIPVPEDMNFEMVVAHQTCDGALSSTELRASDASDEATLAYLRGMMEAWGSEERLDWPELNETHNTGIRGLRNGEVTPEGHLFNVATEENMSRKTEDGSNSGEQMLSWEALEQGGYRFFLDENTRPGSFMQIEVTPETEWLDFPRPETIAFASCSMETQTQYSSEAGVFEPVSSWNMTAVEGVTSHEPARQWMMALLEAGWQPANQWEGSKEIGEPLSMIGNDSYTYQFSEGTTPLSLWIRERATE